MWSRELIPRTILASSLFVGSQARVQSKRDVSCDDVSIRDLRDDAEAKVIWDDSLAGFIGDEYINAHGIENWVQDLDQEIFDSNSDISDSWDCADWGTECGLEKECTDYAAASQDHSGSYFLFYSLQQYRSWIKSFHERLQDNAIKETLDIWKIQGDFEKEISAGINVPVIIAASLGIAAGFASFNPLFAGGAGVAAGVAVASGTILPPTGDADDGGPEMADQVQSHFEELRKHLDNLNGAVFGKAGFEQDLIPQEMIKGDYENPVIGALGDGQWLTADPTAGLAEAMDEMYRRMRQGLAWQMLRHAHHAFVFIDNPVKEHECGYNYNAAIWDPDQGFCFRLFQVGGGGDVKPVPDDLGDTLWEEPYNLDRLEVYRNAFDCWVENEGDLADPEYVPDLAEGSVPKCFFNMKVIRGTYLTNGFANGEIRLAEWMSQKSGEKWDREW